MEAQWPGEQEKLDSVVLLISSPWKTISKWLQDEQPHWIESMELFQIQV